MQLHNQLRKICTTFKEELKKINTFESIPPSTDPRIVRNEKISTWLFILLFIVSISILLFYNSFVPIEKTFTVKQPTYSQYSNLVSKYPNNLVCPCKTVSVAYAKFLQVNYTLHGICNSFLVSEHWILYLSAFYYRGALHRKDFRAISSFAFQTLRSFCEIADETIQNSLKSFYTSQYVSAHLTASDLFRQQNDAQIQQFISTTINTFLSSLKLIRQTTQNNALYVGIQTNFDLYIWELFSPIFYSVEYSGCSCGQTALCFSQAVIFNTNRNLVVFIVPGFYSGCYTIEALLVSTFQCFYDEQCFTELIFNINSTLTLNATILNQSLSTKFKKNSTVGEMINELMVEQWKSNITFIKYYDECEPSQCTYSTKTNNDAIYIITAIFGLLGGLVTILRIVVPRTINYFRRERNQVKTGVGESLGNAFAVAV